MQFLLFCSQQSYAKGALFFPANVEHHSIIKCLYFYHLTKASQTSLDEMRTALSNHARGVRRLWLNTSLGQ